MYVNRLNLSRIISEAIAESKENEKGRNVSTDPFQDFTSDIPINSFVRVGTIAAEEISKRRKPSAENNTTLRSEIESQRKSVDNSMVDKFIGNTVDDADDFVNGTTRVMKGKKPRLTMDLDLSGDISVLKYTEYSMNFVDHKSVGKFYAQQREKEIALRSEYGFGTELPDDAWQNKKREDGQYVYGGPGLQPIKQNNQGNTHNKTDKGSKFNWWLDDHGNRALRQTVRKERSVYFIIDNTTGACEVLNKPLLYLLRDEFGKEKVKKAIEAVNAESETEEQQFKRKMNELRKENKFYNILEKNILFISYSDKKKGEKAKRKRYVNQELLQKYKEAIPLLNLEERLGKVNTIGTDWTSETEIEGLGESYTNFSRPENPLFEAQDLMKRMLLLN